MKASALEGRAMEREFMKGCEAIAEAAVRAGCRFFAGYPITPQNEVPEYFSWRLPEVGGSFVQAESEVAAINMVYGAASTGTLAMTSSSSPGISLKTEGISYLAAARIPALIMNVQRGGPGIGTISAAQSDYFQAVKAPGHGGFRCMVFSPATVQETVDLIPMAFEKSQRDRNPAIMLVDGCIGAVMEPVVLPEMKELDAERDKGWELTGCSGRESRCLIPYVATMDQVAERSRSRVEMYERWDREDALSEELYLEDAEIVLTAYGTAARVAKSVVKALREKEIKAGIIRPITVSPFPREPYRKIGDGPAKLLIDIEMTQPGQMLEDVLIAAENRVPAAFLGYPSGVVPTDSDMLEDIERIIKGRCL